MSKYKLENGNTLEVIQDTNPINPRKELDNMGTMVCFHTKYILGDDHEFSASDFYNWEDMEKKLSKLLDAAIILPIYMYDHSGITIKTTPFNCPWDSGQIGYILVSKATVRNEYKVKRISKQKLELVEKVLLSEIKEYNQYLTGDVYGYQLFDEAGQEISSCWGFFGSDPKTNGIEDSIGSKII